MHTFYLFIYFVYSLMFFFAVRVRLQGASRLAQGLCSFGGWSRKGCASVLFMSCTEHFHFFPTLAQWGGRWLTEVLCNISHSGGVSAAHVFMEITPSRLSIGFVRWRRQDSGTVFVVFFCATFKSSSRVPIRFRWFRLATLLAVLGMTC